jgi:outer membrane protein assembly factor BamB
MRDTRTVLPKVFRNEFSGDISVKEIPRTNQSSQILILSLASCILIGAAKVDAAETNPPWPMYQGNPAHTGYVPINLNPLAFTVRWTKVIHSGVALNQVTAAEGKVFVSGNYGGGLQVIDARTGNILWTTNYPNVFSVNPPSYAYGKVYIQTCDLAENTYLQAYQVRDGRAVFRKAHSAQWPQYLAPTIYDGNVYVDGGEFGGMYSFNATNGLQNWFGHVGQNDGWTPTVDAKHCYVFAGSGSVEPIIGEFRIIDRLSGTTRYLVTDDGFECYSYTMNAVVVLGAHTNAFAISASGSPYPEITPYGRLLSFDLRADVFHAPHIGWVLNDDFIGQPTVANGVLYVNKGGSLTALDELTGSPRWNWTPPDGLLTGTMIATKNVVLATTDTAIYAVDLRSHETLWSYPASGTLSLGEGVLYVAGKDGSLTAITAPAGNPQLISRAGGPYTVECKGAATALRLDATRSNDSTGNPLSFAWSADCATASFDDPTSPTPVLTFDASAAQTCTVNLLVSNGPLTDSDQAIVRVIDRTPPTIVCGNNKMVEPGTSWDFDEPVASDACCGTNITVAVVGTVTNRLGNDCCVQITRTWRATDCSGNSKTGRQTVTVSNPRPPDLSRISVSPATLWPTNNRLVTVHIRGNASSACGAAMTYRIVSVTSSDPDGESGRNPQLDSLIVGSRTLRLRAKSNDPLVGRTYQVLLEAKDSCGNIGTRTLLVTVPGSGN